jgi:hypothetical protein
MEASWRVRGWTSTTRKRLTERTPLTTPPDLTIKTKTRPHHGCTVRILAPPFESCVKCGNMNNADAGTLFRVADERGAHLECDACGHDAIYA